MTAVDNLPTRADLLSPETLQLMIERPSISQWQGSAWYYAMGWAIRPVGDDANWWHTGSLPGTVSIVVRSYHGFAWVALFNARPSDRGGFGAEVDDLLWEAVGRVETWPEVDLFDRFP